MERRLYSWTYQDLSLRPCNKLSMFLPIKLADTFKYNHEATQHSITISILLVANKLWSTYFMIEWFLCQTSLLKER